MRQLGRVDGASFEYCERAFAEAVPREDDVAFFATSGCFASVFERCWLIATVGAVRNDERRVDFVFFATGTTLPFVHIFVEALDAVFERWVGAKQPAKKPWLERVHHKHISA